MMPPERVTVVGNGVAGYACARRLAAMGAPVTMIGPGLPCDRPPLSKRALHRGSIPYLADAGALAADGIDHLDGWAVALDVARRQLLVRTRRGGSERPVAYERLVWATGVRIARPPVPGIETADQNVDAASTAAVLPRLAEPGRRIVVIGGGLIGCETAATLGRRHQVTLAERCEQPLGRLHPAVRAAAGRALAAIGVPFLGGCAIERIDRAGGGHIVRTSTHGDLPADVVLVAAGVEPTLPPALGGGATVATDERLAVLGADAHLGLRRRGRVPASALRPHRRPALGQRPRGRRARRRGRPRRHRAVRPRPVLVLRHRAVADPAGRLRARSLRLDARRRSARRPRRRRPPGLRRAPGRAAAPERRPPPGGGMNTHPHTTERNPPCRCA